MEEQRENNKPKLFQLLDEYLDWEEIIPARFYNAFCRRLGRKHGYGLESFLRALFLRRIFHYVEDFRLFNTLWFRYEMRDYCGFKKVPDASKIKRFKQDSREYIRGVFERLADMTEPICMEMDKALTVFDTTGIESCVTIPVRKRSALVVSTLNVFRLEMPRVSFKELIERSTQVRQL